MTDRQTDSFYRASSLLARY